MLNRFEQFSSTISGIYSCIQKLERDEMVKLGYRGSFAQYLVALSRSKTGLTAAQLCEFCDKDKAAVSRVVCEMEAMDLVVRDTDGSRYRALICLTEKGKQAAAFACDRVTAAVDVVGNELTEQERSHMYALLERIAKNLQQLVRDGIPQTEETRT